MINKADSVNFQNNDFFGRLCLESVQELVIHNINFPMIL